MVNNLEGECAFDILNLYRPFGNPNRKECKGMCYGHYLKPAELFPKVIGNMKVNEVPPPTEVLKDLFNSQPNWHELVEGASSRTLLSQDKVTLFIKSFLEILIHISHFPQNM